MSDEKRFPVLRDEKIKSVPWDIIEPHRQSAMKNHGQTLERLAERGGLSLAELIVVMTDRGWNGFFEMKR